MWSGRSYLIDGTQLCRVPSAIRYHSSPLLWGRPDTGPALPVSHTYRCVCFNSVQILCMTSLLVSSSSSMSFPKASSKLGTDDKSEGSAVFFFRCDISVRISFTIWSMYWVRIEWSFLPWCLYAGICSQTPSNRTTGRWSGSAMRVRRRLTPGSLDKVNRVTNYWVAHYHPILTWRWRQDYRMVIDGLRTIRRAVLSASR